MPLYRRATARFLVTVILIALTAVGPGCAEAEDSGTTSAQSGEQGADVTLVVPGGTSVPSATAAPAGENERTTLQVDEIVQEVAPAVVDVRAFRQSDGPVRQGGAGAGVIFREDGLIVTNNHILTLGGDEPVGDVRVVLPGGEEVPARIVGRRPDADLAVLAIEREGLAAAQFAQDLEGVESGLPVVVIGSEVLDDPVASGRVTAVQRGVRSPTLSALDTLLQHDAPIEQGYSGGPLVDARGVVIGITIAETADPGDGGAAGFAIPAPTVTDIAAEIVAGSG